MINKYLCQLKYRASPAKSPSRIVYFKIECDFTDKKDIGYFFYSLDGASWNPIGTPLHMSYTIPHFMGYRFGLFNYATKTPGGYADFDFFRISDSVPGGKHELRYTNPITRDTALSMRDYFIIKAGKLWYSVGTSDPIWIGPNPGVRLLVSEARLLRHGKRRLSWESNRYILRTGCSI